jgi:hypothetical protein
MKLNARQQWLIAQALHVAAREMRKEKHPETNNIEEMERLLSDYFPHYKESLEIIDEVRKRGGLARMTDDEIKNSNTLEAQLAAREAMRAR